MNSGEVAVADQHRRARPDRREIHAFQDARDPVAAARGEHHVERRIHREPLQVGEPQFVRAGEPFLA